MWFGTLTDSHFKINQISVNIYTDFENLSRADCALVSYLLTDSCERYPDYKSMSNRYADLYGMTCVNNNTFGGDMFCSSITSSVIGDGYALNGEQLERGCCETLLECIFRPKTKDGAFDPQTTGVLRAELADIIRGIVNDKKALAKYNAAFTAFEGEPQGKGLLGTTQEAESVTPESAWRAYRRLIERGHIEIICAGCSDFSTAERIFAEAFAKVNRHDICELSTKPSILKPQPRYVKDAAQMQQAVTRMYFKAPELTDRAANAIFSLILGGIPTSRFFMNIREKQSLCYYCSCISNRFKRTLTAYAGVEPQNVEQTQRAILREFENVCENGVTAQELEEAKTAARGELSGIYDSASAISGWYLGQVLGGDIISPEEYRDMLDAVTAERVQAAARLYTLDTVYTLGPAEVEQ